MDYLSYCLQLPLIYLSILCTTGHIARTQTKTPTNLVMEEKKTALNKTLTNKNKTCMRNHHIT